VCTSSQDKTTRGISTDAFDKLLCSIGEETRLALFAGGCTDSCSEDGVSWKERDADVGMAEGETMVATLVSDAVVSASTANKPMVASEAATDGPVTGLDMTGRGGEVLLAGLP
jgi:hypothetical protein